MKRWARDVSSDFPLGRWSDSTDQKRTKIDGNSLLPVKEQGGDKVSAALCCSGLSKDYDRD